MLLSLCYPIILLLLNNLVIYHVDSAMVFKDEFVSSACLLSLLYAVGLFKQAYIRPSLILKNTDVLKQHHQWVFNLLLMAWGFLWGLVWLALPMGMLFKIMLLVGFFVCSHQNMVEDYPQLAPSLKKCLVITLVTLALIGDLVLFNNPYTLSRLLNPFIRPLALYGYDFPMGVVINTWFKLKPFAASSLSHYTNNEDMALLRLMGQYGYVAGAMLSASMLAIFIAMFQWLRNTTLSGYFTQALRKLGLILLVMLGVQVLAYVMFNFGLVRKNYSGMYPFVYMLGWMFWVAMAIILGLAINQNRVLKLQRSFTYVGYGLLVVVFAGGLIELNDFQRQKYFHELMQKPIDKNLMGRQTILDANDGVIAQDEVAYNILFTPTDFYGHSILNPKSPDGLTLTDESRKSALLNAVKPWPNMQARFSSRLSKVPADKSKTVVLAWAVAPPIADAIKVANLQGVEIKNTIARQYPQGKRYANTVGFVAPYDITVGQEGLEYVKRNLLATGSHQQKSPLQLNLLPEMQQAAIDTLQTGIGQHQAVGGAMVVIDLEKGNKISAMVSEPSFDPNLEETFRNPYQPERILNRATSLSFPIGDLLTPLLLAQGLQTGKYSTDSRFKVGGHLIIGNEVLLDLSAPQEMSLQQLLNRSSDVAYAKNGLDFSINELESITKNLGIGQPLRIDGLTSGVTNDYKPFAEWDSGMQSRAGWFIETNLMQVMLAYTPFISGRLESAYLIDHGMPEGNTMLSQNVSEKMRNLLSRNLTIKTNVETKQEIAVAIKTSTITGKRDVNENGETIKRNDVAVLIAMLPKDKPKYLVGIMLEFPHQKAVLADKSLVPIFAGWVNNLGVAK